MKGSGGAPSQALTWGELLRADEMKQLRIPFQGSLDREVLAVRLIAEVEDMRTCRPGTVAVLQGPVAAAPWAVEIAVRYAWERNVRCVIAKLDGSAAESVARLAERLQILIAFHDGDLPDLALRLAAVVSRPESVRSRLVSVCAIRLAEQTTVAGVMTVLNREIPGVEVTLSGSNGVLVGAKPSDPPPGGSRLRVAIGPLDFYAGRELIATVARSSAAWTETVTRILEIARVQLVACEAGPRVALAAQSQREQWALERLLELPSRSEPGDDMGWPTGNLVGAVILAVDPTLSADPALGLSLRSTWSTRRQGFVPVPYRDGWAIWDSWTVPYDLDPADPAQIAAAGRRAAAAFAERVESRLGKIKLGVEFCVGVGNAVTDQQDLRRTLREGLLAARAARSAGRAAVINFNGLGARAFLASADTPELREIAQDTLAPLVGLEDFDQLVITLAAYLDCNGSSSRAADRLRVHRNTITSRMDRIRRAGIPIDDADRRLALHVACYLAAQGISETWSTPADPAG